MYIPILYITQDITIKHCKLFEELDDIFDQKTHYNNYHRYRPNQHVIIILLLNLLSIM